MSNSNPQHSGPSSSLTSSNILMNESPDGLVGSNKFPPSAEPPFQAAPPSPTSNHSLGSIDDNDDVSMDTSRNNMDGIDESAEYDSESEDTEEPEFDVDTFNSEHISTIASEVSMVLQDIVTRNDTVPFSPDKLTRFHSRAPPGISVRDYVMRIIKFCNLDKAVLLVLLYLVDLFTDSYPNFVLNSLTVHRFLITSCTVAAKGLCDQFCSNTHYAKVGGVSVMELNLLEVEFLTRVRYRIVPNRMLLPKYYAQIQAKRPFVPAIKPPGSSSTGASTKQNKAAPVSTPTPPPSGSGTGSANASASAQSDSEQEKRNILLTRKHARDESNPNLSSSASDSDQVAESRNQINTKQPGRPGNKGFRAMKDTFRFLQPSKKKRGESSGA